MPHQQPILPYFCNSRVVLVMLILGIALAALMSLSPGIPAERGPIFAASLWVITWIGLGFTAVLCTLQKKLEALSANYLFLVVLGVLLGVTALVSMASLLIWSRLIMGPPIDVLGFMVRNLAIALVFGSIGLWIFLLHVDRLRRLNAQNRAELSALHARIRPHFLFNSLNTAAELTQIDPAAAERALLNLASLFRAALNADNVQPLETELQLAQRYCELAAWRMNQPPQIHWQIPEPIPKVVLPILSLQPLLENALRFAPGGARIEVSVNWGPKAVSVVVENPISTTTAKQGNGIALSTIIDRLDLLFSGQASLRVSQRDKRFRVKLVVPRDHPIHQQQSAKKATKERTEI